MFRISSLLLVASMMLAGCASQLTPVYFEAPATSMKDCVKLGRAELKKKPADRETTRDVFLDCVFVEEVKNSDRQAQLFRGHAIAAGLAWYGLHSIRRGDDKAAEDALELLSAIEIFEKRIWGQNLQIMDDPAAANFMAASRAVNTHAAFAIMKAALRPDARRALSLTKGIVALASMGGAPSIANIGDIAGDIFEMFEWAFRRETILSGYRVTVGEYMAAFKNADTTDPAKVGKFWKTIDQEILMPSCTALAAIAGKDSHDCVLSVIPTVTPSPRALPSS